MQWGVQVNIKLMARCCNMFIGASLREPHTYRTAAKNLRHIYIYTSVRPATRKRTTGTTGNVQPAGREYNLRCNHNIFCAVRTAL